MTTNNITGDAIRTRGPSEQFDEGYDRIFGGHRQMKRRYKAYKDTLVAPGTNLWQALEDGDTVKAEALYQECERNYRKEQGSALC
jgi:hypothetical protein